MDMHRFSTLLLAATALAGCRVSDSPDNAAVNEAAPAAAQRAELSLTRLDCGTATIKNFDAFFSDRPGHYGKGPRTITDSCYPFRHGDQAMLWDTGFSAPAKGRDHDLGDLVARLD
jgi:hypothetical protein